MFHFDFCKGGDISPNPKFRIKNYNNGWHRFLQIEIPTKPEHKYDANVICYQITYWDNYKKLFGKQPEPDNTPPAAGC